MQKQFLDDPSQFLPGVSVALLIVTCIPGVTLSVLLHWSRLQERQQSVHSLGKMEALTEVTSSQLPPTAVHHACQCHLEFPFCFDFCLFVFAFPFCLDIFAHKFCSSSRFLISEAP